MPNFAVCADLQNLFFLLTKKGTKKTAVINSSSCQKFSCVNSFSHLIWGYVSGPVLKISLNPIKPCTMKKSKGPDTS